METTADVVVLGGDLAAGVAAASLAKSGLTTSLVVPASADGTGRLPTVTLWGTELDRAAPELVEALPVERRVVAHRFGFLTPETSVVFDYQDATWARGAPVARILDRVAVATATARAAGAAGASVRSAGESVKIERDEKGRVAGVSLDGTRIRSRLVLLSDPAWFGPLESPGGRREISAAALWPVGARAIENRFSVRPGESVTLQAVVADAPPRLVLGSVTPRAEAIELRVTVARMQGTPTSEDATSALTAFARNPAVAPWVVGVDPAPVHVEPVVEWPGTSGVEQPGLWLLGEAAGLHYATVVASRDAHYGVRSGLVAARAAADYLREGHPRGTVGYSAGLRGAGIASSMARERTARAWRWDPRMHRTYPELLGRLFHELMSETGARKRRITATLREVHRASGLGWTPLIRDALSAGDLL